MSKVKLSWYCLHCGDEQEPYFIEALPKWDDCEENMEWGECPAHGDSNKLRQRIELPKKHQRYVPKRWVIRWKADGEWIDEEGVEVKA